MKRKTTSSTTAPRRISFDNSLIDSPGPLWWRNRLQFETLEERRLLTVAGTLDTSFGVGGIASISINSEQDVVRAMAIQPDGKIILAGGTHNASNSNENFALARFTANGQLDLDFGSGDGKVTTDMADDDYIYDVVVQPDKKILVAGSAFNGSDSKFAIARYTETGVLDTSFSGDGKLLVTVNGRSASARSLALLDDGKILVAGNLERSSGYSDFALLRLNSDGSVDTTFQGDGWVFTPILSGDATDVGSAIVLQPNGNGADNTDDKIVFGGYSGNLNNSDYDFAILRYGHTGELDDAVGTGFSGDGKDREAISATRDDKAFGVALDLSNPAQPKIVLSGWTETSGGELRASIVRYNNDGSPDNSFSGDGQLTLAYNVGNIDNLSVQSDGKILLAARTDPASGTDNFALIRLLGNGAFDTGFDSDGVAEVSLSNQDDVGSVVALDSQGRILIAGRKANEDFGVARFTNDLLAGSLQGRVYVDTNGDGQFTTGEQPIAGAKVSLYKTVSPHGLSSERLVWETTTDGEGKYLFTNLPADTYTLKENTPPGFNDGLDHVGTLSGMLVSPDTISEIVLPSLAQGTGYDFGEIDASNNTPIADRQTLSTLEDTGLPITLTGSDVDNNSLSFFIEMSPLHGTLSGTAPHVTYTPNANYFGPDDFTFKVYDGTVESSPAHININVAAVNDAPVLVVNSGISVNVGGTLVLTPDHLLATDVDNLTADITYMLTGVPANGELQKNSLPLTARSIFSQQDINNGLIRYVHNGGPSTSDSMAFESPVAFNVAVSVLQPPPSAGSEFRVNTLTTNWQSDPAVAMDADGNYVVVWTTYHPDSYLDVVAQRYNSLGIPQGSEFLVNSYTTQTQGGASIAMDAVGNFVVVWDSYTQDGDTGGVYGQRFSAQGVPQGSEFRVNSVTTGYQLSARVARDADGDFAVAFLDSALGIFVRRFDAQGNPQGSEQPVSGGYVGSDKPGIAMDSDGDFVVAWSEWAHNYDVYAQRFTRQGALQGSREQVNSDSPYAISTPAVAMNAAGDFLVTWSDENVNSTRNGIVARRYDWSGASQHPEFQVNLTTTSGQQTPRVAFDADGTAVFTWASWDQDGDQLGVFGRTISSTGVASEEFRVNEYTQGTQAQPVVAAGPSDTFVIAWTSVDQDGDQGGIYARRYGPAPTLQVTSLTPTTTGFVAEFNRSLNLGVLNLYPLAKSVIAPDIVLTGVATGLVQGSVAVGENAHQLTFVSTTGLLPADTYNLVFKSGATAFTSISGLLLDGDKNGTPGDDYHGNFTISPPAANAVTLTAPNLVRGRTQSINWPTNTDSGFPITISKGQGVGKVEFELHYDPQLLSISSITLGAGINGSLSYTSSPGALAVSVNSTSQFSATSGELTLVNILASVPVDAPYGGKHVLDLTQVHVYDATVQHAETASVDRDGLHLAAFFGEASGDQDYNAPDASAAQNIIVGNEKGLAAYPLVDPNLMLDADRDGAVQSDDTSQIQSVTVGKYAPNIPAEALVAPLASTGPDPLVFIPQNLSASAGQTITVPVALLVTEPTGINLAGVELAIAYDAARLELDAVALGELLVGFGLNANLATPGVIRLSMTASSPLDLPFDESGVLAELSFKILGGNGPTRINLLGNAESLHTALYDDLGRSLLLQPAPTNDADDSVDGLIEILALEQVATLER